MFDTVIIDFSLLELGDKSSPLAQRAKEILKDVTTFQTKSLGCTLDIITLTKEGLEHVRDYVGEDYEIISKLHEMHKSFSMPKTKPNKYVLNYHGIVYFYAYSSHQKALIEFCAVYYYGNLVGGKAYLIDIIERNL